MSLIDMWKRNNEEMLTKGIQQIIAFAGDGKLRDNSLTCSEFRAFLGVLNTAQIEKYTRDCLGNKFDGNGYVLQDLVNEIGRRIGCHVEDGLYRGKRNDTGNDGLWTLESGHHIIVEVKTSTSYNIQLDTIANYRKKLISNKTIEADKSSLLLVIGRNEDTSSFEAMVRGSRHAWDMRIISVEALIRLMKLKEKLDDPQIMSKIAGVLIPQEFTRVDRIVDIVFATAEDTSEADDYEEHCESEDNDKTITSSTKEKPNPVSFHEECVIRVSKNLNVELQKETRTVYADKYKSTRLWIAVSKRYVKGKNGEDYWFAFKPHQKESLEKVNNAYIALGCGSADMIFKFPLNEFASFLEGMHTTVRGDRMYWHVRISKRGKKYILMLDKNHKNPDITRYLMS